VDGSLRVGTLLLEREKMELRYFSFISGVVGVDCGPFHAFKVSDLYLDSYLYFSQPKTNPIFLFSIYKFYCYKLNHNFCHNYLQKLRVLVKVTINHNLSYRNNCGLTCSTKIFV